ncbi:hypothetical protein FOL46_000368 [Perkinsus olseni]|uniref:Syntaxin 6/10/61 N-terminal domain-containing protein n=1 Tax=Perkinsus olseni TaxID=32597 RepID=A0A7J6MJX0_PEROL|nr:hypothetical protein FOL46_000368 [Perkinsus olseni]
MASSAASDPFYVARDEVQSSVDEMSARYEEWQTKQASGANLARSARFEELQQKLKEDVRGLVVLTRGELCLDALFVHERKFQLAF